jgi:hypothetical protein
MNILPPYTFRSNLKCIDEENKIYRAHVLRVGKISPYTNTCYTSQVVYSMVTDFVNKSPDYQYLGYFHDQNSDLSKNDLSKLVNRLNKLYIKGNKLFVEIKMLDTPYGNSIQHLYKEGMSIYPILSMEMGKETRLDNVVFPSDLILKGVNIQMDEIGIFPIMKKIL